MLYKKGIMNINFTHRVDVYFHNVPATTTQPDALVLTAIENLKGVLMNAIDNLETEVSQNSDVVASAVALLTSISAELAAAKNDPVKIQALADKLDQNTNALAAAVAANTIAAPEPEVPVEPAPAEPTEPTA